jgi:hypothetical protein
VTFVDEPEAHVLVPVKVTFTPQRRNAEIFELAGNVIVNVKRLTERVPELFIWNVRTVPLPMIPEYGTPVLVNV